MSKLVTIENCQDCPHISHAGVCQHPDILDDDGCGQRISDEVLKARDIPSWCPLVDVGSWWNELAPYLQENGVCGLGVYTSPKQWEPSYIIDVGGEEKE